MRAAYPELHWGEEADLMAASSEWPEAVLAVDDDRTLGPETAELPYPITLSFLVFPRRRKGEQDVMLPTVLAMLRDLSARFECPVLTDATDHHPPPEPDPNATSYSGYTPPPQSSFLMQGGVLYTSGWSVSQVSDENAKPGDWLPVPDVPHLELGPDGRLSDPAMVETYRDWRLGRTAPPPIPDERVRALYQEREDSEDSENSENSEGSEDSEDTPEASPQESEITAQAEPPTRHGLRAEDMDDYFAKVDGFLEGRGSSLSQRLIERGIPLPAPDELDEAALSRKLAEIIAALAAENTYLHSTNHFSDRELYAYLWGDALNEVSMDFTGMSGASYNIDLLGTGSPEDSHLQTTHYHSPRQRAHSFASWPEEPIPAHLPPQFDRDRHLPKPPRPGQEPGKGVGETQA